MKALSRSYDVFEKAVSPLAGQESPPGLPKFGPDLQLVGKVKTSPRVMMSWISSDAIGGSRWRHENKWRHWRVMITSWNLSDAIGGSRWRQSPLSQRTRAQAAFPLSRNTHISLQLRRSISPGVWSPGDISLGNILGSRRRSDFIAIVVLTIFFFLVCREKKVTFPW